MQNLPTYLMVLVWILYYVTRNPLDPERFKPKKRDCIPLVMRTEGMLFGQEIVSALNKLKALGEVTEICIEIFKV